ncbi:unnamed protein product [Gongylonema pulchrum]|uniref:Secreted protein n=1 Tax=Gongylonema pulchrum TaxID=637853 RepID=A0A183EJW1_9BILA|nr:unnamed protein product [Gongylonema pulchrum]
MSRKALPLLWRLRTLPLHHSMRTEHGGIGCGTKAELQQSGIPVRRNSSYPVPANFSKSPLKCYPSRRPWNGTELEARGGTATAEGTPRWPDGRFTAREQSHQPGTHGTLLVSFDDSNVRNSTEGAKMWCCW